MATIGAGEPYRGGDSAGAGHFGGIVGVWDFAPRIAAYPAGVIEILQGRVMAPHAVFPPVPVVPCRGEAQIRVVPKSEAERQIFVAIRRD